MNIEKTKFEVEAPLSNELALEISEMFDNPPVRIFEDKMYFLVENKQDADELQHYIKHNSKLT